MSEKKNFFDLYRRKGFAESLKILAAYPKGETKQKIFLKKMDEHSYQNAFFRVKGDLLKFKLIAYKLDQDNDYVIFITEKGLNLLKKIRELEEIFKD